MPIIDQAIGAGIGMLTAGWNDERQLRQQQDLQNMQIRGQKDMTDYSMMKQMEMWRNTNYPAQLEMMKKAGLSPGLMYGKGGGGGTTVGSATGNVTGGQAPSGGGEIQAGIGMAMQSAMQEAQIENIKANTEKTKAETGNVPLAGQQIQAQTGLTNVNIELAKIEQEIKGRSTEAIIRTLDAAGAKMIHEADAQAIKNNVAEATWNDEVLTIKGNLIGIGLRNLATEAGINLTKAETDAIGVKLAQAWKQIEINNTNAETAGKQATIQENRLIWDKAMKDVKESTKLAVEGITEVAKGILRIPSKAPKTTTKTSEGMKDKEGGWWETTTETRQ